MKYVPFLILILATIILGSSFVSAESYVYTYSTGKDIRMGRITVTGQPQAAGLQVGPTKIFPSTQTVGTTAVHPIVSGGVLTGYHIFKNFVDANGRPAVSRLLVDAAGNLQNEQLLTRVKPTRFDILDVFRKGGTNRLLFAFSQNDVFSALLNASGIAPGAKSPVFNNPSTVLFTRSAGFSADGEAATEIVIVRSGSTFKAQIKIQLKDPKTGQNKGAPIIYESGQVKGADDDDDDPGDEDAEADVEDDEDGELRAKQPTLIFLVFRAFRNVGTPSAQSRIRLQVLNSPSGTPVGPPRSITNFVRAPNVNAELFNSLKISPNADLILYTVSQGGRMILKGQLINSTTGAKIGGPRVLVGASKLPPTNVSVGAYALDISEVP